MPLLSSLLALIRLCGVALIEVGILIMLLMVLLIVLVSRLRVLSTLVRTAQNVGCLPTLSFLTPAMTPVVTSLLCTVPALYLPLMEWKTRVSVSDPTPSVPW